MYNDKGIKQKRYYYLLSEYVITLTDQNEMGGNVIERLCFFAKKGSKIFYLPHIYLPLLSRARPDTLRSFQAAAAAVYHCFTYLRVPTRDGPIAEPDEAYGDGVIRSEAGCETPPLEWAIAE